MDRQIKVWTDTILQDTYGYDQDSQNGFFVITIIQQDITFQITMTYSEEA